MSHHIYHTRGVILGSMPIGESNRFYKIFTEELGLVHATAQAVREAKSKLRYSLQDFSWASLDLVRGRDVWRITSAQGIENETWGTPIAHALPGSPDLPGILGRSGLPKWSGVAEHDAQSAEPSFATPSTKASEVKKGYGRAGTEHRILFARVCALVSRLVHGEDRNEALFIELFELALFLERGHDLSRYHASCEALASLRVLAHLGYFNTGGYQEFVGQGVWSRDILEAFENVRPSAVYDINRAMKETHL